MTYLKSTLIASAFTAATASAAFAGGDKVYSDTKMTDKTTVTSSNTMPEISGVVNAKAVTKKNDTVGEILQADGQADTQSDYELLTHDGDMLTKTEAIVMDSDKRIADNAIVVPSSTGAITTVNCPIGTTAQPDMTCHVTGNYDLEKSEKLRKQEVKSDAKVMGVISTNDDTSDWKKSDWNAQDNMSSKTEYKGNAEYKGTLRPDTVVVSNIDK